jgi:spore germination protein GerM
MPDSVAEQAKRIITELAAGPRKEGLLPTLPAGTKVLGVYLDRAGTAFLDLSEEFVSLHPGGSDDEITTIFSVVDALTWNVKEIKRVRFLVGGEERDTLKNHLDLRRAYLKDMSIVNMDSTDGAGGGAR